MNKTAAYMPSDLNRLDRETGMALATVASLSAEELAAPSRVEGWSRAHVVAQLISNARALGRLVNWAVTGEEQAMFTSAEALQAEIDYLAGLPAAELKQALREANDEFAKTAEQLRSAQLAVEEVEGPIGPVSAYWLPAYRTSEVILRHHDLDTVWELEEADIDALEDALDLAVEVIKQNPDYPGLQIETDEGESYTIGDGTTTLKGGRDAILGWITRGGTHGLRYDGELPERPEFG